MQPATESQFFSEQNQRSLYDSLARDAIQRGVQLDAQQNKRLAKTLGHYMQEVWDVNGPMPLANLNREVLSTSSQDFTGYLRRNTVAPNLAASQRIVSDPANQPRAEAASQRLAIQQGSMMPVQPRPTFENNLLMDTGSRFEQMQQDRIPPAPARPPMPDFQTAMVVSNEEPSALSLYERAKKMREEEASRTAAAQAPPAMPIQLTTIVGEGATDINPLVRFMSPPSIMDDANGNPTIAQPVATLVPPPRGPLPQDFLIKQDDIINYKETEYNLVLYSADRDWLNSNMQNRYTFSVNFDPGNTKQGFYPQLTTNKKFKNISRIELVKAILPTEGLIPMTQRSSSAFVNTAKLNALTYPYIVLRIPELDVNNYGSDDILNNSFAVLQYDANWYSDTTNVNDGYLAMIPKFMKCQKVYQPTPLATLQKLTIELLTPEGQPLSTVSDTLSIQNIYISGTTNPPPVGIVSANYKAIQDSNTNGEYLFIQTSTYFSKWQFTPGNRIAIQGLQASQVPGGDTMAAQNLINYLQNPAGLPIIDIAYTSGGDGANSAGYANVIIVRTPHVDPTTGSILVQPIGGTNTTMATLAAAVNAIATTATTYTQGKLINLTHQTNIVLRIITRDLDSAARVRPDNL
jgi:hypothetical protein